MTKRSLDLIDRHVAQSIKLARKRRGMTQIQLAAAIGISYQRVQKYENGDDRISASVLFRLGKGLNISPAHFYEGIDSVVATGILSEPAQAGYSAEAVTADWQELKREFEMLKTDAARRASLEAVRGVRDLERQLA
jgi:transcriptional regulator with XRE-family HTH domain